MTPEREEQFFRAVMRRLAEIREQNSAESAAEVSRSNPGIDRENRGGRPRRSKLEYAAGEILTERKK